MITCLLLQSCYPKKVLSYEKIDGNISIEIIKRDWKGYKSVIGTLSNRLKKSFTTIQITDFFCDSVFLLVQSIEPVKKNSKRVKAIMTRNLIVFDNTPPQSFNHEELLLLNKLIEIKECAQFCNVDLKKATGYKFISRNKQ